MVRLVAWSDPISRTESVIATDTLNAQGEFSLAFTLSKPGRYFLVVRRFRAMVYAQPAQDYHIAIPPNPLNARVRSWQPGEMEYYFIDLPEGDVNVHVHAIDSLHYAFFLEQMERAGTSGIRRQVLDFENQIKAHKNAGLYGDLPFTDTYFAYSLAATKLLAGFPKRELFREYLQDKPLEPHHPMWYAFFDSFFADYFQAYEVRFGGENIPNRLRGGLSPEGLDSLLLRDDFLQNDTLRRLVMLKSPNASFFGKNYPKEPLAEVVEFVRRTAASREVENMAERILKNMNRSAPVFANLMEDAGLDTVARDTSRARVVMVSASWNKSSQKEAAILCALLKGYGDVFGVVEISIDGGRNENPWPVGVPTDTYAFLAKHRIFSPPIFYYLPPGEEDTLREIQNPSEGLEAVLYALQAAREKRSKFRVGQ